MGKSVRTTTAWGGLLVWASTSCGCRFLVLVCHWRMNDRINNLFLFSFVIEEYMHLGYRLCSSRKQQSRFVEFAASETTCRRRTSNADECDEGRKKKKKKRLQRENFNLILKWAFLCWAVISKASLIFKLYRSSEVFRGFKLPWRQEESAALNLELCSSNVCNDG